MQNARLSTLKQPIAIRRLAVIALIRLRPATSMPPEQLNLFQNGPPIPQRPATRNGKVQIFTPIEDHHGSLNSNRELKKTFIAAVPNSVTSMIPTIVIPSFVLRIALESTSIRSAAMALFD